MGPQAVEEASARRNFEFFALINFSAGKIAPHAKVAVTFGRSPTRKPVPLPEKKSKLELAAFKTSAVYSTRASHPMTMKPPRKPPRKAIAFRHPQSAIEGLLEARVERLFESNVLLTGALVKLRDFYLAGIPSAAAAEILAECQNAIASAEKAQDLD
jgi:hypothetical protein